MCYINVLSDAVLIRILSMIPIRERVSHISVLERRLHRLVFKSINSVSFYRDNLDVLSDDRLESFISQYGSQLHYANFDLYRSALMSSQWKWRLSIKNVTSLCWNLRSLDILFCDHHKLRDADLIDIFKSCPHLVNLRIDAQFIRGHSLQYAPRGMQRLVLEMCYRLSQTTFHHITNRLHKLRSLHLSQLLILSDKIIADIVKNLTNLTDLSLVSHPETIYEELTGAGLGTLARLRKLRTLCTEGLAAVTDRFLILISDENSAAAKTITSLSLAFCFNLSIHGLYRLAKMPKLSCLNLDGITKRDIGPGVERIAAGQRLVKLFLAEGTNVSPDSLVRIVQSSPMLRTLDISSNEGIHNYSFAQEIIKYWAKNFGRHLVIDGKRRECYRPLYILTDEHLPWNIVDKPETDKYGRTIVTVVHIRRESIPEEEIMPTTVLSNESPLCLPNGVMAPQLRRGNRYRLMWSALGPTNEPRLSISPTLQLDLSAFMLSPQSDYDSSNHSQLIAMIQELLSNTSISNTTTSSVRNDESVHLKKVDAIEDNSFDQSTALNPSPALSTYQYRTYGNILPDISSSKTQLLSNDDSDLSCDDHLLTQSIPTDYQQLMFALQQQETSNDSFAQLWPDMLTTTTMQHIDKENRPLQNESSKLLMLPSANSKLKGIECDERVLGKLGIA
ncbi:unnamed protein product [Anisakis simplex]|uniref:F-box domain-containing protein n=1 Tax=Anisakis simplex TaxID=6269 RepID=A0A3P6QXK8_ANISI|nr:unnamed protein product [Anisakis simplex]